MGMAASQARLLCITARIHDVEYQSQAIQNSKLQLATQSDRAYDEYNEALAATTLTINALNPGTGETNIVAANFNNLCSKNRVISANGLDYAIRNKNGLLIVDDEIEEKYNEFLTQEHFETSDAYAFALYMLGDLETSFDEAETDAPDLYTFICDSEEEVYKALTETEKDGTLRDCYESILEMIDGQQTIYGNLVDHNDNQTRQKYDSLINTFRNELYKRYADKVLAKATNGEVELKTDSDRALFNYYVSIFKQIQAAGGCISIEEYNGSIQGEDTTGRAANDTEWLQGMIQSGYFSIEIVNTDEKTGQVRFSTTSPSSDSCLAYTTTTVIDNTALAKAEAKYEHTLRQINKKDQKFDLDLSKLESERKALTTEYESVKKVVEENIDRTFGIFS